MKTTTQVFGYKKDCKHSVVFEPVVQENAICTSIYINRSVLLTAAKEVKITLMVPEGGQDAAYNAVK